MIHSVRGPKLSPPIIRVGDASADIKGFDSFVIQCALDAAHAKGGGKVMLSKGEFIIHRPLFLYDNITLCGEGEETVLKKAPGAVAQMTDDIGAWEFKVSVGQTSGFYPGAGLLIHDDRSRFSSLATTAVITAVEGDQVYFTPHARFDYNFDANGTVSTAFSIIEIIESSDVTVERLRIDGDGANNTWLNGNVGGGIYMKAVSRVSVEDVTVEYFNGDGISWQVTEDVVIRHCNIHHCDNFGVHPGTGTERTLVEHCSLQHNGKIGLFVCYRVKHGIFRNNDVSHNGMYGMCIGHKDTDNLFQENRFCDNGECGIYVRSEKELNGAHRNRYERNVIENNGGVEKGHGVYIQGVTKDNVFIENIIRDTKDGHQKIGIWQEADKVSGSVIKDNQFAGHAIGDMM